MTIRDNLDYYCIVTYLTDILCLSFSVNDQKQNAIRLTVASKKTSILNKAFLKSCIIAT